MIGPLALQIQRLGGFNEQVLVLLHAAELGEGRCASPGEVAQLFRELRLPLPKNERQHLVQLRRKGLAMQPEAGRWATTPEGREEIRRLMGQLDPHELTTLDRAGNEAIFAGVPYHVIPPFMAPGQFQQGISRFLDGHPFDRNVLCITRYPRHESDPVGSAIEASRQACNEGGLELHLASDRIVDDLLLGNVGACMWACRYGIVILEDRADEGLNYNVALEIGAMLATGRRCLLLKDTAIDAQDLPTDLIGYIYKDVDLDDPVTVQHAVTSWIEADLGLG